MLFENDNRQRISCIWLYFLIIATIILLFSCSGVPQEHYDLVTAQLKAEKIRNEQLSKERDKFVVELEEENTRNDKLSKDLATTQSKVHDLEKRLDDFQDKVDEALLSVGILNSFLELELVDDTSNLLELMARLGEIENEEIKEILDYLLSYGEYMTEEELGFLMAEWFKEIENILK